MEGSVRDKQAVYFALDIHEMNLVLGQVPQHDRRGNGDAGRRGGPSRGAAGAQSPASEDTIAALVAGTFSASHAMAAVLGAEEFSSLIPRGGGGHLLLLRAGEGALIAVVFDDSLSPTVGRTYALEAIRRLESLLSFAGFSRLGAGQFAKGEEHLRKFVGHRFVQRAPAELRDLCVASVDDAVRIAKQIPEIRAGEREWASPAEQALAVWATEELAFAALPARLFEDLLERAPEIAGEPIPWPQRWHYASYGVIASLLASRGLGRDGADLTAAEREHWRRKALEWMKLDLALWRARSDVEDRKRQYREWLYNGIYALARAEANLRDFPEDEAEEWRTIWDEIRATLRKS